MHFRLGPNKSSRVFFPFQHGPAPLLILVLVRLALALALMFLWSTPRGLMASVWHLTSSPRQRVCGRNLRDPKLIWCTLVRSPLLLSPFQPRPAVPSEHSFSFIDKKNELCQPCEMNCKSITTFPCARIYKSNDKMAGRGCKGVGGGGERKKSKTWGFITTDDHKIAIWPMSYVQINMFLDVCVVDVGSRLFTCTNMCACTCMHTYR